jgi:4-amino-4-deoxy-L-arabinose transferase-like glycosyltransferase
MSKKTLLLLSLIIILGLGLRLLYFDAVTFGYDQARDALQSISIIKNADLKIIGPTTDIRGLFHSPLYWYIISPFYYFSGGDPAIARIPMILINILNIILIYFIAKELFKSEKIALLSSLFMAVSFEAVQYGRWLSNPPPALLTVGIFFFGLWLVLKKRPIGLPLMLFVWGFSVDFQFFLVYQVAFLIGAFLYLFLKQKQTLLDSFKKSYWLYGASIVPWVFYITSEIKFKFQGMRAIFGFFTKQETGLDPSIIPKIMNFWKSLIRNVAVNLTGYNKEIALYLLLLLFGYVLYLVIVNKKLRGRVLFLLMWLLSPVLIYPLEKNNSYFLNIGNLYPLILLTLLVLFDIASYVKKIGPYIIIGAIGIVIYNNLHLVITENKKGETLFSVQYVQVLTDEKKVMDYTYIKSNKKMFSFNTLTNPLFINTTWAYLYNWYGKNKYGYMPIWEGAYLDDFGKEIQFTNASQLKEGMPHYMIFEPPVFPDQYIKTYSRYENKRSDLLQVEKFGTHVVEARRINKIIHFFRDDISYHLND